MVTNNLVKSVIDNGGSIIPLIIDSKNTNGTGLMNPSILIDGDTILCNIRHVNYTLVHCEGKQIFGNRYGPLAYLNPENDLKLRTTNYLCELNTDFKIKSYEKIDMSNLDITPMWTFIGLEDARLVRWENKLYITGVRRDTETTGIGRMELSEIQNGKEISRLRIEAPINPESYCEKNWMLIQDMPYHYVKWTNPTEIVKVDINTGKSEQVILKNGVGNIQDMRGSSQIISYKENYICIIHETKLWKNKLAQKNAKYTHRFVVWDKDWNIIKITDDFSFMDGEIEFCCGLEKKSDEFIITFGFQDNAAYLLRMPETYLNDMIWS